MNSLETFRVRFHVTDFNDPVPGEGFHPCFIHAARGHTTRSGAPAVLVLYELEDVPAESDRVVETFLIGGSHPRAVALGRRRLVELCRACGIDPREEQELCVSDLVGAELDILIGHVTFEGRKRARVLDYRSRS